MNNNKTYLFKPKGCVQVSSEEKGLGIGSKASEIEHDDGSASIPCTPILTPVADQTIQPGSCSNTDGRVEKIQVDGASGLEIENQTNIVENGRTIQFSFHQVYLTKVLRSVRMTLVQHCSQQVHTNIYRFLLLSFLLR